MTVVSATPFLARADDRSRGGVHSVDRHVRIDRQVFTQGWYHTGWYGCSLASGEINTIYLVAGTHCLLGCSPLWRSCPCCLSKICPTVLRRLTPSPVASCPSRARRRQHPLLILSYLVRSPAVGGGNSSTAERGMSGRGAALVPHPCIEVPPVGVVHRSSFCATAHLLRLMTAAF